VLDHVSYCPNARPSGRNAALCNLYLKVVRDALNETSYQAYLAELDYDLSMDRFGVNLAFTGFTEKMPRLAKAVFERLSSGAVSEDRFLVIKEQALRGYVLGRWG